MNPMKSGLSSRPERQMSILRVVPAFKLRAIVPNNPKPNPPPRVRPPTFELCPVIAPLEDRVGSLSAALRAINKATAVPMKRVFESVAWTPPSLSTFSDAWPLSAAERVLCVRNCSLFSSCACKGTLAGVAALNCATCDGKLAFWKLNRGGQCDGTTRLSSLPPPIRRGASLREEPTCDQSQSIDPLLPTRAAVALFPTRA
jgi:hypothetical protein